MSFIIVKVSKEGFKIKYWKETKSIELKNIQIIAYQEGKNESSTRN